MTFARRSLKAWPKRNAAKGVRLAKSSPSCGASLAFTVEITPRAERDLNEICIRVAEAAPFQGVLWYERLVVALHSLSQFPHRFPEVQSLSKPDRIVRQLLFGRRHVYRVFYTVLEERVSILHVRHGARKLPNRL